MTKTVHDCWVQITPPHEETGFPGVSAEGKFVVNGDTVTLTDAAGVPVKNVHGKVYSRKLNPDESPVVIARRLTKEFHSARRGKDRLDFNRALHYKRDGSIV
jgi:uncharacterized protein YxjI